MTAQDERDNRSARARFLNARLVGAPEATYRMFGYQSGLSQFLNLLKTVTNCKLELGDDDATMLPASQTAHFTAFVYVLYQITLFRAPGRRHGRSGARVLTVTIILWEIRRCQNPSSATVPPVAVARATSGWARYRATTRAIISF